MNGQDLAIWLTHQVEHKMAHADELAIYALSHLYNRHMVVFGKNRPWCTIRPTGDPKEVDFINSCHVHLLYIGVNMFAPLRPCRDRVPSYIQKYQCASDINWARLPETNYAAYFKENEYSDFVEVLDAKPDKTRSKASVHTYSHPHRAPASTVTSGSSTNVQSDQPVFPGNQEYSVTYEFDPVNMTSSNIEHIVTIKKDKNQCSTLGIAIPATPTPTDQHQPLAITDAGPETNTPMTSGNAGYVVNDTGEIISVSSNGEDNSDMSKERKDIVTPANQLMGTVNQSEADNDANSQAKGLPANTENVTTEHDPSTVGNFESSGSSTDNSTDYYTLDQTRDCFVNIKRLSEDTLNKYVMKTDPIESTSSSSNESDSVKDNPGMVLRERIQTPQSRTL